MAINQIKTIAYGECQYLDHIYIRWDDPKVPTPSLDSFDLGETTVPVTILPPVSGFVTDRFIVPDDLKTDTILSIDDDLGISAIDIQNTFLYYKEHNYKDRIFGLSPRDYHDRKYEMVDENYTMVLTNYAFLNIRMLEIFNNYGKLIRFVNMIRNGEDILMNYIVATIYKTAPVAIQIETNHNPTNGISLNPKHSICRVYCCHYFEKFFGSNVIEKYRTASIEQKKW